VDNKPLQIGVGNSAFSNKKLPIIKKPQSLDSPQITLSEIPHLGKLNIRCAGDDRQQISKLTGYNLALQTNQLSSKAGRHAICLGPDEYLLLAEQGSETRLEKMLNSDKIINKIAVTNVSDALCALSLSGLKVRELLSKGCAIDLHPDSFGRNKSVQCDLALANVIIACIEANETDEFLCICRTSFAEYVLDWMIDAGYEFGIIARSYA